MRGSLENRDKAVEELRIEISCQSDRYDDIWLVHETLLEETQKLRYEVIALSSGPSREHWRMARGQELEPRGS